MTDESNVDPDIGMSFWYTPPPTHRFRTPGNNDLLRDFDRRKKDIASMQVTLEGLKGRHRTLREQVVDINAKTLQASY